VDAKSLIDKSMVRQKFIVAERWQGYDISLGHCSNRGKWDYTTIYTSSTGIYKCLSMWRSTIHASSYITSVNPPIETRACEFIVLYSYTALTNDGNSSWTYPLSDRHRKV